MKLELCVVVKELKDGSLPYLHGVRIGDEICQVPVHVRQLFRSCACGGVSNAFYCSVSVFIISRIPGISQYMCMYVDMSHRMRNSSTTGERGREGG